MNAELVPMHSPELPGSSNQSVATPARFVRFGSFHLDLQNEELFKDGSRVRIQGKVYQVLVALIEKPGDIVTREALRMRLWPSDTYVNYDANVNTTMNKLRQILGDTAEQPTFVDTIPRKGYSFVAPVEYVDQLAQRDSGRAGNPSIGKPETHSSGHLTAFLGMALSSNWFMAGVISLIVAGMLLGAAVVLYAYRGM